MISDMLAERQARRTTHPPVTDAKQGSVDVDGDILEVDTAETVQTFADRATILTSDEFGWPRGAEVIAGRQLGQTPIMELVKNVISDQLTGGDLALPFVEENPPEELEAFRDLVQGILQRDHVGGMEFDDLIDAAVSDFVDVGWAYWEVLPSADGTVPLLQLKPVDALTIQHNLNDQGQFETDDPAFYHAPAAASASGAIQPVEMTSDPTPLSKDQLIMMRAPRGGRSNTPYGYSPAVKAREWLEIFTNATADINRDYDDTQIPEGVFMPADEATGFSVDTLKTQLRNSAGDKRKGPILDFPVDWLDIGYDTTDVRIMEQEWFFKMLLGMFGASRNEIGMTENTGLGTETPAQATLIYKKIFLPLSNSILGPLRYQGLDQFDQYDGQFAPAIEDADPRQEVVEQEQARKDFQGGVRTLNEVRETLGEDQIDGGEATIDVGGASVDWANTPRWVVEQMLRVELNEQGQAETESGGEVVEEGPPDFDADPVLSEHEAAEALGVDHPGGNLAYRIKQLADTIEVQSSFIESIGYFRPSDMLQIEFEREGRNAIYWYGGVEEFRFFNMLRASSKGQYFNRYIRHTGVNDYPYTRIQ